MLHVRSWYRYAEGTRSAVLRDQAPELWDFESPAIQEGLRSRRLRQRFLGAEGEELEVQPQGEDSWQVTLGEAPVLVVERSFQVPDRTTDHSFQQPSSASLGRTSLAFLGREFFLWPEVEVPSRPQVLLTLADSPNWSLVTVTGEGRLVSLPSLALLRDHFVFAGKDPVLRSVDLANGSVVLALSERDLPEHGPSLEEAERLVRAAGRALGPLAPVPHLVILQPFRDTQGARQRAKRGASTPLSHLVYLDQEARPYYPEHPLGVLAHELTHAWLPYSLGVPPADLPTWFTEGVSAWYEAVHPWRAGLWDEAHYLDWLAGQWAADRQFLAGQMWALGPASDRFTEALEAPAVVYRRGALLAAWLDVLLREARPGEGGLDGFLRRLVAATHPGPLRKPFRDILKDAVGEARYATVEAALDHEGTFSLEPLLDRYGARLIPAPGPSVGFLLDSERLPVVRAVQPDGPADGVLEVGDVIRRLDDQRVATTTAFQVRAESLIPGEEVRLLVQRGEERLELRLTPASALRYEVRADPDRDAAGPTLLQELGAGPTDRRP